MSMEIRTDWRTIEALCESLNAGLRKPTWTPHGLRHYVREASSNGLAPHVRRIGRRILITESGLLEWINGLDQGA